MTPLDVSEAIERFANKLAEEFEWQADAAINIATAEALNLAASAARNAGKTNRTRRREARGGK